MGEVFPGDRVQLWWRGFGLAHWLHGQTAIVIRTTDKRVLVDECPIRLGEFWVSKREVELDCITAIGCRRHE